MKRIINKQTGMFLRDDFTFDKETEIGLEIEPAQGFYRPKWNGKKWIEGLTPEEIQQITKLSNEDIRQMRAQAYKETSDSLYIAWQKYLILGDERAEEAKQAWLDDIERINNELPYS